jgi:hypothetical protein
VRAELPGGQTRRDSLNREGRPGGQTAEAAQVLVTTNQEFRRWSEVFGDATLTAALLDRLTHHSQVLVFEAESYRFRESAGKLREKGRTTS